MDEAESRGLVHVAANEGLDNLTFVVNCNLQRLDGPVGGNDYRKVYAAYQAAIEHHGQPTVILAKTIKGYGLGPHFAGRNATHQMKKLTLEDLKAFRNHLRIPIPDEALE